MRQLHGKTALSLLPLALGLTAMLHPGPAIAEQEEFTCRDSLFGTRSCQSDSGTTIKSRTDLFGTTHSTVTTPEGSTTKCRSRPGLFGTTTTVCD